MNQEDKYSLFTVRVDLTVGLPPEGEDYQEAAQEFVDILASQIYGTAEYGLDMGTIQVHSIVIKSTEIIEYEANDQ